MDASAYLKKQGWRGDGHSLDRSNRGIRKPLLVSKKVDVLGLGSDKHAPVSDQWWLRAFDQGLKNLGSGKESVLASVQKHGINRGGLYGRFVQGEDFAGSIGVLPHSGTKGVVDDASSSEATSSSSEDTDSSSSSEMAGNKRKRDGGSNEKRARQKIETPSTTEERSEHMSSKPFDPVKEAERRKTRQVEAQVDRVVLEAQRRGIIPLGPNEVRKGIVPVEDGAATAQMANPAGDDLDHILHQIGLKGEANAKLSRNIKAQKYAREKMKRDLRRAAKAHLLGEKPPEEQSKAERKEKKEKKRAQTAQKKADAAKKDAERMATREERAARKREVRARRAAEKAETMQAKDEQHVAWKAGKTVEELNAHHARKAAAAAAEVELAEQILKDRGLDAIEPEASKTSGLEEHEGKRRKKAGGKTRSSTRSRAQEPSTADPNEVSDGLGFTIDTEGDASLSLSQPHMNIHPSRLSQISKPAVEQPREPQPWDDVDVTTPALSNREAKKLAKAAKREERGMRPLHGPDTDATPKKKPKGQRKVEAREAFMKQILYHSRRAHRDRTSGSEIAVGSGSGTATVDGIANVPLVKVETLQGQFKKGEVSAARTVARRIQRMQKREERAKKGKGKGWKKRERAANDMERNAGFLAPIPSILVHVAT